MEGHRLRAPSRAQRAAHSRAARWPLRCPRPPVAGDGIECGRQLQGLDASPMRQQVTELPPIVPQVTEYQLNTLCCSRCQALIGAALPPGVPVGSFGPRLQAIVSVASGSYQLSERKMERRSSNKRASCTRAPSNCGPGLSGGGDRQANLGSPTWPAEGQSHRHQPKLDRVDLAPGFCALLTAAHLTDSTCFRFGNSVNGYQQIGRAGNAD